MAVPDINTARFHNSRHLRERHLCPPCLLVPPKTQCNGVGVGKPISYLGGRRSLSPRRLFNFSPARAHGGQAQSAACARAGAGLATWVLCRWL